MSIPKYSRTSLRPRKAAASGSPKSDLSYRLCGKREPMVSSRVPFLGPSIWGMGAAEGLRNSGCKLGPPSDTRFLGKPWRRKTWLTRRFPASIANGILERRMNWTALENLSITMRMVAFPSDGGRAVTKSTAICDKGHCGIWRGLKRPAGGWWEDFPQAHTEHDEMKALVPRTMEGHQKQSVGS